MALVLLVPLIVNVNVFALQHEPLGTQGMQPGTAPEPGFYYISVLSNITADKSMDAAGNNQRNNFDLDLHFMSNIFIYSTDYSLFGGNYYTSLVIPICLEQTIGFDAGPTRLSGDSEGLDDISVTPLGIGWHKDGYDLLTETTIFLPVGKYNKDSLNSIGQDHYTFELSVGGTYYFDEAKKYFGSIKANYEKNLENEHSDFTEGDHFHTTFGAGASVGNGTTVGVTGYYQKQLSDDKGSEGLKTNNEEVWALGPEISAFLPDLGVNVKFRYMEEFDAVDRSMGRQFRLTIGKRF